MRNGSAANPEEKGRTELHPTACYVSVVPARFRERVVEFGLREISLHTCCGILHDSC
jgi:hypothetical protein